MTGRVNMKIDRETIEHLEKLARIELDEVEREKLAGQLDRIVKFVEKLDELDTSDVEFEKYRGYQPVSSNFPASWLGRDKTLEQAPDTHKEYFRVPRVIDRGEDD